jgi:hypothetical protein
VNRGLTVLKILHNGELTGSMLSMYCKVRGCRGLYIRLGIEDKEYRQNFRGKTSRKTSSWKTDKECENDT